MLALPRGFGLFAQAVGDFESDLFDIERCDSGRSSLIGYMLNRHGDRVKAPRLSVYRDNLSTP